MSRPKFLIYGLAFLAALGLGAAASEGQAADLGLPAAADIPNLDQNVEFGTGWYIRGDVAYANDSISPLTPDLSEFISGVRQNSLSLGGGFGYKFTNMFRTDLVLDYRKTISSSGAGQPITCVTQLTQEPTGPVVTATDTCTPRYSASIRRWDMLANAYVDFGTWYGFTPYVGAGAGLSITREADTVNYFMTNGLPYQVTTDGFFFNFDHSSSNLRYQFAWALMAGTSYAITPHILVDLGYRYINLGNISAFDSVTSQTYTRSMNAHEIRLGFRYMID